MVVLEALGSGVPIVTTRSTTFISDLIEKLGFEKTECWPISLPEYSMKGAAEREQFGEGDQPRKPCENLIAKAESAGFSDTRM